MNATEFDQIVDQMLESWHCPGIAVAVVQGDDVLYQRTTGLANLKDKSRITSDTRFALASITKPFTAMSAAMLVDEGKLDWDLPVCERLPALLLNDAYATRHITLRDMLAHRTGLPRHDYAAWRLQLSRAEFIERMRHFKLATSLRARFQYNNLMYVAAAHLVETVATQRWESFVQQRIFDRLGMQASSFGPPASGTEASLANGYQIVRDHEGQFSTHIAMPFGEHTELSPGPAGALFSTLGDMTRWLQLCINEGRHGSEMLLSRAVMREMRMPQIVIPVHEMGYSLSGLTMLSYGLGWYVRPYPFAAATLVYHDGNVEGHSAHISFIPEEKVGVVVLANVSSSPVPTVLAREALDRVLQLPRRDWSARFHAVRDPIHLAESKAFHTDASEPPLLPPASHPLEDFEGRYGADGYPDFAVRLVEGALEACTVGSMPWSRLSHQGFDTFEWYVPAWDSRHKARFSLSQNGEIETVSLPISGDTFEITFKRKALQVESETLVNLAGDYIGDIPGLQFQVRVMDGRLYWTELGLPKLEAFARRAISGRIEFSTERGRLIFLKSDESWDHVQLQTESAFFNARRLKIKVSDLA